MRFRSNILVLASLLSAGLGAAKDDLPPHLKLAEKMVAEIKPANNRYKNGKFTVTWAGVDGASVTQNESDCTTYLTALLKTAYHFNTGDFNGWFGANSPSLGRYYDAAVADKGLQSFKAVADLRPGDVLISKYAKGEGSAAGHLMICDAPPVRKGTADGGLTTYEVTIIDCTGAPHARDTRSKKTSPTGEALSGIGRGTMQVYADAKGDVAEWSWSAGNRMVRYSADKRPILFAKVPTSGDRR